MWIITGSNGQLGQCLQKRLSEEGIDFLAVSRNDLDITDANQVVELLSRFPRSIVVNTAAWTAVDNAEDCFEEAYSINATGVANLVSAAMESNSRLIQISTDYVFDGLSSVPYSVTSPTNPVNSYGLTKKIGEDFVFQSKLEKSTIIRTAWLYSEHGKNFVKTMVNKAIQELPVRVVDDQIGQPTNAYDLADLILRVGGHQNPPKLIHGTNSGNTTWCGLTTEIYKFLGLDRALVTPVSSEEFPTKAPRPQFSILSHQEFTNSGLAPMLDWKTALLRDLPRIVLQVKGELHE